VYQVMVTGVPTDISFASRSIALFSIRTQRCETLPGKMPGSFVPWTPTNSPPGHSVTTAERPLVPNASGP
jgi:hypothetical protein